MTNNESINHTEHRNWTLHIETEIFICQFKLQTGANLLNTERTNEIVFENFVQFYFASKQM